MPLGAVHVGHAATRYRSQLRIGVLDSQLAGENVARQYSAITQRKDGAAGRSCAVIDWD